MLSSLFRRESSKDDQPKSRGRSGQQTYVIPDDLLCDSERKVLIVEDDLAFAALLTEQLKIFRFDVRVARNGKEGLERILCSNYDLILCDMVMPQFPGDMFYRAVERLRPELCKRFLFMTGHCGNPKIDAFIRSVRGVMIWKPFQIHELQQATEIVLRKSLEAGNDIVPEAWERRPDGAERHRAVVLAAA